MIYNSVIQKILLNKIPWVIRSYFNIDYKQATPNVIVWLVIWKVKYSSQ